MRAAVVAALGAPPAVRELPDPAPGPGQSLVRVRAAALNPVDLLIASGGFYAHRPAPPYVPGVEGAGEVVASSAFAPGTRVRLDVGPFGGALAELAAVDDERLAPLPDGLDFERAAAGGNAGLAAWLGLRRGAVGAGDAVLVLGATGVVGGIATQAARLLGAARVVAAGRDPQRLARVGRFADAAVPLAADARERLAEAAGAHGFDLVLDMLWGEYAPAAMAAAAPGARYVQLGHSAGATAAIPAAALRARELVVTGVAAFSAPPAAKRQAYAEIAAALAGRRLELELDARPLDEVAELWRRQGGSPGCKLVARA